MSTPKPAWHVQMNGQVYGPYTTETMEAFTKEGRVVGSSMITPDPARGYFAAERFPVFTQWLETKAASIPQPAPIQKTAPTQPTQAPISSEQTQQNAPISQPNHRIAALVNSTSITEKSLQHDQKPTQPQIQMRTQTQSIPQTQHKSTVFLVMAEIRSGQTMGFLQALQSYGDAQRIGDNLWLVRGATTAQLLRNTLSQTLTREDRLFILDSFANQTAWFNIGAEMDNKIRDLWSLN